MIDPKLLHGIPDIPWSTADYAPYLGQSRVAPTPSRTTCRGCGQAELHPVVDLGDTALSRFPTGPFDVVPTAPLALVRCAACSLVQMAHATDPHLLYSEYWYRSGINETMVQELTDVVVSAWERVSLQPDECVLDIGANDGTLCSIWQRIAPHVYRMAVEPSQEFQVACCQHAHATIQDYFPSSLLNLPQLVGKVKVLTTIAMFYDLDDPLAGVAQAAKLLHPDGVWVMQFQDLLNMLQQTAFDNICHEHILYLSLGSLQRMLHVNGLKITDVLPTAINGGSLRVFIQHREKSVSPAAIDRISVAFAKEDAVHLDTVWMPEIFSSFAFRIQDILQRLNATIDAYLAQGATIDLYGASTKGNTLLELLGGWGRFRAAIERTPQKVGRFYGRTAIPVVSEAQGRLDPADIWLCPIWQFREAVLQREAEFLRGGGTILFPLPHVDAVRRST